jgi:hypothetical protein
MFGLPGVSVYENMTKTYRATLTLRPIGAHVKTVKLEIDLSAQTAPHAVTLARAYLGLISPEPYTSIGVRLLENTPKAQ